VPPLADDLRAPTRWPLLDGFRGLAVLLVVLYHGIRKVLEAHHLVQPDAAPIVLWPLGIGKFTVDAFFVLSGFLIVAAWDNRPEWGPFLRRRVRRVYPAYLVSVLVLVPLIRPELLGSAWDLVLLVTMQGYLSDGLTSSVNVPWWSLTTEIHFYLLVPLLALVLHRRFARWALVAGACALSAWWWSVGAESVSMPGSLLPGRLPQFLVGALVGIALREGRIAGLPRTLAANRWLGRLTTAGLVVLGVYLGANGTYHRRDVAFDHWIEPMSGLLLGLLLLHLVVRTEDGRPSRLDHPALRGAGLVSYSLYLWHYPILVAAVAVLDVAATPAMAVPALVLGFAASAAVTWLSYRFVERPTLPRRSPAPAPARASVPVG
jgi:peptidoglycan/LPS O-acetylase OafA/YrhL